MADHDFSMCKLYDGGRAPNPRRVRIFLAEKNITVPLVPIDMAALGHRGDDVTALNPMQRLPVFELEDGRVLTESIAICRYVEALCPSPSLFGLGAYEQALIEMWQRRVELHYFFPVAQAFRHIHPAMKDWEVPQVADWGAANKFKALEFAQLLNEELRSRAFVAGDALSVADITAVIATDFCKPARIKLSDDLEHFQRWYAQMRERPSYSA